MTTEVKTFNEFERFLFGAMVARRSVLPFVESPIEADFAVAVINLAMVNKIDLVFSPRDIASEFRATTVLLVPQWRLSGFRYDFMMRHINGRVALIECDGKEFHSTEEQIANDKRKNEAAVTANMDLFRINGAELHYRHHDCGAEVLRFLGAL